MIPRDFTELVEVVPIGSQTQKTGFLASMPIVGKARKW